ncbi:MAG: DUF4215 domain-containing protein, partial [Deltaproteobacteria bacterium]|nr:DUF4215 domain-containing protein [Deltaproteobacteria bacterium]
MNSITRFAVPVVALAVALGLSSPAMAIAPCGDGALAPGEACDDGNQVPLDGCSDACSIEAGWTCGCATPKFAFVEDTLAGVIGGQGGSEGPEMGCGAREVLIGLRFDFSDGTRTATRTTVYCGEVVVAANGTVTTTETTNQTDGGGGCGGWDPSTPTPKVLCPSGWAVVGVHGRRADVPIANSLFHSASIVCGRLGVDGKPTGETQELPIPGMTGASEGVPQTADCPAGKIGRYFQTRRGCGQDGLWLYCSSPVVDCSGQSSYCVAASCGDGILAGAEQCDDSNAMPFDGCDGACQVEEGWECKSQGSNCAPICGDGLVRGDEECDDGNDVAGDGCSDACVVEEGWQCQGEAPSVCTQDVPEMSNPEPAPESEPEPAPEPEPEPTPEPTPEPAPEPEPEPTPEPTPA